MPLKKAENKPTYSRRSRTAYSGNKIPIVAGYDWILSPASIFVAHYIKEFYIKFESILQDMYSLSLVKVLEKEKFDTDFLFHSGFWKSMYKYSGYTCNRIEERISSRIQRCYFKYWFIFCKTGEFSEIKK